MMHLAVLKQACMHVCMHHLCSACLWQRKVSNAVHMPGVAPRGEVCNTPPTQNKPRAQHSWQTLQRTLCMHAALIAVVQEGSDQVTALYDTSVRCAAQASRRANWGGARLRLALHAPAQAATHRSRPPSAMQQLSFWQFGMQHACALMQLLVGHVACGRLSACPCLVAYTRRIKAAKQCFKEEAGGVPNRESCLQAERGPAWAAGLQTLLAHCCMARSLMV